MVGAPATEAEQLLRGLAESDESSLRLVLAVSPSSTGAPRAPLMRTLTPATSALVHVAALLAAGASTTSLRWAVELALRTGARDEEIVEVLATVGSTVGSARVVAAAPRLALAMGYDIEVEGWDGY
jgi:alkylhydroperoxidase/carboxymuconolactone decarboxylase family protein YurZ